MTRGPTVFVEIEGATVVLRGEADTGRCELRLDPAEAIKISDALRQVAVEVQERQRVYAAGRYSS